MKIKGLKGMKGMPPMPHEVIGGLMSKGPLSGLMKGPLAGLVKGKKKKKGKPEEEEVLVTPGATGMKLGGVVGKKLRKASDKSKSNRPWSNSA